MIEKEIADRRAFLEKLHELDAIGDEYNAACIAETKASNRRNAARNAYRKCWAEMELRFPGRQMPFYVESVWGPKPITD